MPEGYTHIRTAERALELAGLAAADKAAFGCGANGPDTLFFYQVWRSASERSQDLPRIGSRMHHENTGALLLSLLKNAKTPSQKSYVLGFLSHYAADCILHPYVNALTQKGKPYSMPGGHSYFEIGLESWLYKQDTGSSRVPVSASAPKLSGSALAGAAALLQKAIWDSLSLEVSREALADAFWHTRRMRRLFSAPVSRYLYGVFWLAEPAFGGRGRITGHITPAPLSGTKEGEKPLPARWKDPLSGQVHEEDIETLLKRAEQASAAYMLAAAGYWEGKLTLAKMADILGSLNYDTGLACEPSGSAPAFAGANPPKP